MDVLKSNFACKEKHINGEITVSHEYTYSIKQNVRKQTKHIGRAASVS